MWNHNTSDYIKLKDHIQVWLNSGQIQVKGEKTAALVDFDPFPQVGMVDVVPARASQRTRHVKHKFETYSSNAAKALDILEELITACLIKASFGSFPTSEQMRGKKYCKFHNVWTHSTTSCIKLKDQI